jgi:hypothetical protein
MCALLLITSAEGSWGLANTAELELPQINSYFMIRKRGEGEKKDHAPQDINSWPLLSTQSFCEKS